MLGFDYSDDEDDKHDIKHALNFAILAIVNQSAHDCKHLLMVVVQRKVRLTRKMKMMRNTLYLQRLEALTLDKGSIAHHHGQWRAWGYR